MDITIQITNAAIAQNTPAVARSGAAGAWAEFLGLVRGEENGQPIAALEYEAYSPMAVREMRRIVEELSARHPCLAVTIIHRIGIVPVGAAAIFIGVAAKHRAAAFALLAGFMDRLKQDVPIWKRRALAELPPPGGLAPVAPATPAQPASAGEVLALLERICRPLEPERVPLADAAGRVLREPLCAPEDQPPFDRSSVDGYAVRLDDMAAQFRIVDEIRAGDWKPCQLQPGEAVRIATGGALPGDGLQVVMREDAEREGAVVSVTRRNRNRHIRFRGEDARAGQILVDAGTALQPGTLGLLASLGCVRLPVTRLPRVLHVATGNEIVAPDESPRPGQIRDSNSTLVRAFLGRRHIAPVQLRIPEDEAAAATAIRNPQSAVDLLLISGGASVGEHDFTLRLLVRLGFTILVSKTTARPGKPLIVAQRGNALAFGLPGNPLAHFVCLNLYVRAALEAFAGGEACPGFQAGVLAADLAAGGEPRETFWPARWKFTGGRATLTPLRWSSSGDLTSLATANALIRVPAGAERLQPGAQVEFVATEIMA
jgi:molybdopterin molybdotransferase